MRQPKAIEDFDPQAAWESMTTDAPPFKATASRATFIKYPVLRLAQVFLGYNVLGQANTSASVTLAELYFMWCMREQRKVHLGYWIAFTCHMIAAHSVRNLNICHILGEFLRRNLDIMYEGINPPPLCPSPELFGIAFFIRTKMVKMVRGRYYFYQVEQSDGTATPSTALAIEERRPGKAATPREAGTKEARAKNTPPEARTKEARAKDTPLEARTEEAERKRAEERRAKAKKAEEKEAKEVEAREKRAKEKEAKEKVEIERAAWMTRMETMMGQLVDQSRSQTEILEAQWAHFSQLVDHSRALEATLKLVHDRLLPPRRQEEQSRRVVVHEPTGDEGSQHDPTQRQATPSITKKKTPSPSLPRQQPQLPHRPPPIKPPIKKSAHEGSDLRGPKKK